MLVRVLQRHMNGHGAAYLKEPGDEYDHPDPQQLIDDRLVREVTSDGAIDDHGEDAGLPGGGKAAVAAAPRNRQKRAAKSRKAADGADGGQSGKPGAGGKR